jgi:hypothetical protein
VFLNEFLMSWNLSARHLSYPCDAVFIGGNRDDHGHGKKSPLRIAPPRQRRLCECDIFASEVERDADLRARPYTKKHRRRANPLKVLEIILTMNLNADARPLDQQVCEKAFRRAVREVNWQEKVSNWFENWSALRWFYLDVPSPAVDSESKLKTK